MIPDPVPFLANIALVAHADGKLTPSELGHLEAIRSDFKIRKGDFTKAMALAGGGDHGTASNSVLTPSLRKSLNAGRDAPHIPTAFPAPDLARLLPRL